MGTGGTIAGRASSPDDLSGYVAGQVGVADLVRDIPALAGGAVEVEQVAQIDSKDMDLGVWQALVERIAHHLARPDVVGVVVTHGTDTIEETAYLLQSVLKPRKPVVLTCAMRPATALAPDGPQNLNDAVLLARCAGAQGVVVVCAARVHGALDIAKTHTYQVDAFDSGDAGPVGTVEHGQVRLFRPWPGAGDTGEGMVDETTVKRFLKATRLPRVEIVLSHAAADGLMVRCLLEHGLNSSPAPLQGLVVAGTGNGTVHRSLLSVLEDAMTAGVRVVRSTRCARGQVSADKTGIPDSDGLSPLKARLALMLDLLKG
ncbi:L-asparaginase [Hydrogenophaga palleronii]|uniref:L-asparaginase n=1 Tax=Hydrogenophaga palleronii TaxID=65655 RepID=A0ABU1WH46_9BURK|nr:L-asparaginase [Hydrogenophaga palleronii]